jgi:ankyrin repeat protein
MSFVTKVWRAFRQTAECRPALDQPARSGDKVTAAAPQPPAAAGSLRAVSKASATSDAEFLDAVGKGDVELVRQLIARGANAEARGDSDSTPLMIAAANGHVELAELLLAKGADTEARNAWSLTPLLKAASNGHAAVVKCLLEKQAKVDASDRDGVTPLSYAASEGHLDVAECLVAHGADIEGGESATSPPLHRAGQGGHVDVVNFLLRHGANVHARSRYDHRAPLAYVVANGWGSEGHRAVCESLLTHGAELEARDQNGMNALHEAARRGHVRELEYLLASGANKDARDIHQWTPLHWAMDMGKVESVRILLAHGANTSLLDKDGRVPLQVPPRQNAAEIFEFLRTADLRPSGAATEISDQDLLTSTDMKVLERADVGEIDEEALSAILLRLDARSYLTSYSAEKGVCGVDCTYSNPKLVRRVEGSDRLYCPNCRRCYRSADYDDKKRNRIAVRIGTALSRKGGVALMRSVASRFVSGGGKSFNLDAAWDRVGDWVA